MSYLRLEGITKRFGSFLANDRINLAIEAGTIHAVLGENGAGKTTLMNILCGLYQPNEGQIWLDDRPIHLHSPRVAIHYGIGMIHQHFMLVPQLTVTENIILGSGSGWNLDLHQEGEKIAALAHHYALPVNPHSRVGDLPIGAQQRVEILKALYRKAKLLILDEPTAVLSPLEVDSFFAILRQLAATGHTLIFISHKLEEVMRLCHAITILRQGRVVATTRPQDTTPEQLAKLMVGREVLFRVEKPPAQTGPIVLAIHTLQVRDDRSLPAVQNLSLQIHAGEILGIAGVDGNGQQELVDAITGLRSPVQGEIHLQGKNITHWPLQQRLRLMRVGYIPADRQKVGLVLSFSIARNLVLKGFRVLPFCRHGLLQQEAIQAHGQATIEKFDIRATDAGMKVSLLSGGNQQKVVLARELAGEPALIVAMQPTRGLDVGATEAVQRALMVERERGAAILYISTELDELMTVSDRIAVLYEGRLMDTLNAAIATIDQIGLLMTGVPSQKN
ncbi:heme ABC transporter ATP-binding protein [Leptolyngbya sp. 'hensonii']|uniref:ABC transporter ATP-binding protein n=1 Tax=Leptolyngbya sp. 'hensonii' TaxID=1922337 RepID=UPI00095026CE|nr:ABC transporter ATP-binding protein [Leptolyngbya sp. 'hensonii']OLP19108.1 heme ABC transporter ATP-binding protein [Leptolyngbya sp. 'hensonii']